MQSPLTLLLLSLLVLCTCGTRPATSEDIAEEETVVLTAESEINATNAAQVTRFENTPESVVQYFYASRIRKDNDWEKVCVPEQDRRSKFKTGLEKYESWNFEKYRFVSKEEFRPNAWWVSIYMAFSVNGHLEGGEDQITVEKINGTCLITEVPI